jgi:hypothetical protein
LIFCGGAALVISSSRAPRSDLSRKRERPDSSTKLRDKNPLLQGNFIQPRINPGFNEVPHAAAVLICQKK